MRALARRCLPLLTLAGLLSGVWAVPAHATAPACDAPAEALEAAPMAGVFAALAHTDLRILVVGSASTQGGGTSGPAATWPLRLQALLAEKVQPVAVQLEVFGARGTTAADHARILAEQGPRLRPHLIIWQLGTVEAALVTALVGAGVPFPVATPIVLVFRLVTFWARIPIGWVAMRRLQSTGEL